MEKFKRVEKIEELELGKNYFMTTLNNNKGWLINIATIDDGKIGYDYLSSTGKIKESSQTFTLDGFTLREVN